MVSKMKNLNLKVLVLSITIIIALAAGIHLVAAQADPLSNVVVNVTDADNFYSSYPQNSVIHLIANVSGADYAFANFSNASPSCGVVTMTYNVTTGLYNASCNVSSVAATSDFVPGIIVVFAANASANTVSTFTVIMYNMTVPPIVDPSNCTKAGPLFTDLSKITNFFAVNFMIDIYLNKTLQCGIIQGNNLSERVLLVNFTSIDLSSNDSATKLSNLAQAINVSLNNNYTFGNTIVSVDSSYFQALNSTAIVELYGIPFYGQPSIVSQIPNSWNTSTLNWYQGFGGIGNLNFTVYHFSTYTVTDNTLPSILINSPNSSHIYQTSNVTIFASLDGTGTGISNATYSLNGVDQGILSCSGENWISPWHMNYSCHVNKNLTEGTYNLTITAYDYGGSSPGNVNTSSVIFYVNMTLPNVNITSPSMNQVFSNSIITMNFTANDAHALQWCRYNLTGAYNTSDNISCSAGTLNPFVWYLLNGNYSLNVSTMDELGNQNTASLNFLMNDTTLPIITSVSPTLGSSKTSTSQTLSLITNENSTCNYGYSNGTGAFIHSINTTTGFVHSVHIDATVGDNEYWIKCVDKNNNASFGYTIFTVTSSSSPPSGGGNTPSDTNTSDNPSVSIRFNTLDAGVTEVDLSSRSLAIMNISVTTLVEQKGVVFTATKLTVPTQAYTDSRVYEYFELAHDYLDNSNIKSAAIRFKVAKNWLSTYNVDRRDVVLTRYSGSSWMKLPTTMLTSDVDYYYYEAQSPGFSLFAITSSKTQTPVFTTLGSGSNATNTSNGTETVNLGGANKNLTNNVTSNKTQSGTNGDIFVRGPNVTILVIVFILILVVLAVILAGKMKMKSKPPRENAGPFKQFQPQKQASKAEQKAPVKDKQSVSGLTMGGQKK